MLEKGKKKVADEVDGVRGDGGEKSSSNLPLRAARMVAARVASTANVSGHDFSAALAWAAGGCSGALLTPAARAGSR